MKFKNCLPRTPLLIAATVAATITSSEAVTITLPGAPIKGGQLIAGTFTEAPQGTVNTPGVNSTPSSGNENTPKVIDNDITTKYLNFGRENTGYIVIPTVGSSIVTGIDFVTGNDAPARDPASYTLYGSNTQSSLAASTFSIVGNGFTQIVNNTVSLPNTTANLTGTLTNFEGRGNALSVSFPNTTAYTSYILVFPTVRDGVAANSMQIAEARLTGTVVPEPAAASFLAISLLGMLRRRR